MRGVQGRHPTVQVPALPRAQVGEYFIAHFELIQGYVIDRFLLHGC